MAGDEENKPNEGAGAGKPAESGEPAARSAAEALANEALRNAQQAMADLGGDEPRAVSLPSLEMTNNESGDSQDIDLLSGVNLNVKIELGRTRMFVEDVLRLRQGAVVELDKLAGDPVDVYVNDRPVARGEVLILNDNFCVRINEILVSTPQEKM